MRGKITTIIIIIITPAIVSLLIICFYMLYFGYSIVDLSTKENRPLILNFSTLVLISIVALIVSWSIMKVSEKVEGEIYKEKLKVEFEGLKKNLSSHKDELAKDLESRVEKKIKEGLESEVKRIISEASKEATMIIKSAFDNVNLQNVFEKHKEAIETIKNESNRVIKDYREFIERRSKEYEEKISDLENSLKQLSGQLAQMKEDEIFKKELSKNFENLIVDLTKLFEKSDRRSEQITSAVSRQIFVELTARLRSRIEDHREQFHKTDDIKGMIKILGVINEDKEMLKYVVEDLFTLFIQVR